VPATSDLEAEAEDAVDAVQEFALERYLEELLDSNWDKLAFGRRLELWSPDDRRARQFNAAPAGRIDFLCRDLDTDAMVVVELKRGTPSDAVVGQTLRYMGWIRREIARPDQRVEGIIVVGEPDEKLLLAASATPAIRIVRYRIDFALEIADD
jgi:restriction system protein